MAYPMWDTIYYIRSMYIEDEKPSMTEKNTKLENPSVVIRLKSNKNKMNGKQKINHWFRKLWPCKKIKRKILLETNDSCDESDEDGRNER